MDNQHIETLLLEIAKILELKGANTFKVRAYQNAARAVASLDEDVEALVEEDRLKGLPGIGKSIAEKLVELVETGELEYLEDIRQGLPEGVFDLLKVPGLGPKKVQILWKQENITDLAALTKACQAGSIAKLKGFGKKTQDNILEGIQRLAKIGGRRLRSEALPFALALRDDLAKIKGVERIEIGGSLRRGRETVHDADILVASKDPDPVVEAFATHELADNIIAKGSTKSSINLKNGLQVDLRVVEPEAWACAINYFTGSKAFNVLVRQIALDQGYSLNEYSLRPLDGSPAPTFADEAALFAHLGLDFVPPELREDTGEVKAAQQRALPTLVEPDQIRGAIGIRTNASDGTADLEAMLEAFKAAGYSHAVVCDLDHTQGGLDPDGLTQQSQDLEALELKGFDVYHGVITTVQPDGTLSLPDSALQELDLVVAATTITDRGDRAANTTRLLNAIQHPRVRVLANPLGRTLPNTDANSLDWDVLLEACKEHDVALGVSADPQRLDADWIRIKRARNKGVQVILLADARATQDADHTRTYALTEARRGWCEPKDVLNTKTSKQFRAWLER